MTSNRQADLGRLYAALQVLVRRMKYRKLADGRGDMPRDARGVYFFFDGGEPRAGFGAGPRVVRVGTHGVSAGAKSTLWTRLSQHRGSVRTGGGNHRSSVFRLLTGKALACRDGLAGIGQWGQKPAPSKAVRLAEEPLERRVSEYLRQLPYLWVNVDDEANKHSERGVIERGSIALLSHRGRVPIDAPSADWLGHHSHQERVRESGLWNSNHVDEDYDPGFLDLIERRVELTN